MAVAARVPQLTCFSSIRSTKRLSILSSPPGVKSWIATSFEGRGKDEIRTSVDCTADQSKLNVEGPRNTCPSSSESVGTKSGGSDPVKVYGSAKIHDFCFGIPYGGLVLTGGILGFILSRNAATLTTGMLFGGALLALSSLSLKTWRKGKSSMSFVLGQAALSAALFWKNLQAYSLTKNLFPVGFNTVISAAMLFFYSYVMISGGNPPPKKLRSSSAAASLS
ncbi:hypothetical protein K2173_003654 [Erythroxylum novogranatense]|uniref:Protein FATTY ACID EXPORT 1, chloroplastic n=1 Tax=Erythroxylum novogranatense TaxID=1862640 RepID=A0AAV8TAK0_9ROSI|nr:hypothetical protein K2173_003654 [Erythroxylum novogranatense]